jgi:SAM-dependent methyltransferase
MNKASDQKNHWFFIEYPESKTVRIDNGVLSIRGWAWSEQHGRGRLWLSVAANGSLHSTVKINHRFRRSDMAHLYPEIPSDNYAGFEISIDRFDLPEESTVSVYYEAVDDEVMMTQFEVNASHLRIIEGTQPINCICCGGDHTHPVGRKENLTLVKCQNCGMIYTNPQPQMDNIQIRYSDEYFNNVYLAEFYGKLDVYQQRWNSILNMLEPYRRVRPTMFEVGTGAGYLLDQAVRRGWLCSGIDINQTAAAYARNALHLDVQVGDIASWEFPEGTQYGAILMDSTLEHFVDPAVAIAKCVEALHPGGGMFIWTLTFEGDLIMHNGLDFLLVGPTEHLFYFPASSICRMCEKAGLRVDQLWREASHDSIGVLATRREDLFEAE